MRLIDADALIEKCGEWYTEEGTEEGFIGTVKSLVDRQPTIEERKTGKWIRETKYYKDSEQEFYYYEERCSECGTKRKIGWAEVRYCPMCGARLVQEGEDNERA